MMSVAVRGVCGGPTVELRLLNTPLLSPWWPQLQLGACRRWGTGPLVTCSDTPHVLLNAPFLPHAGTPLTTTW